ncbi:MAG: hypothetical protein CMJ89_15915 [Planctomycetes bacterium]|jgi:hypothetical protein|nr:hypothetical protein [Planctomycetota bacterium]
MKIYLLGGILSLSVLAVGYASIPTPQPEGISVGQEAPDFEITEWRNFPEGASSLADLRGRVVLLDFWRTW